MDVRHDPVDPQTTQRVSEVIHGVFQQAAGRLGDMVCADSETVLRENIEAFIDIIRNTHCDSIEPYLIQFLDDICIHCPYQYPTLYCARRHLKACGLFECASALVAGVRSALCSPGLPTGAGAAL